MPRYADPHRCPDCQAPLPEGLRTTCGSCGLPLQGQTALQLFSTLQQADVLLARLRTQPVPTVTEWAAPYPAPERATRPAKAAPAVTWTVPAVLLALGALCLLVGAVVFLAVTWAVLGVGGRTAVLIGFTAVAGTAATWCARHDLRGAAEALALVTSAFLALDVAGSFSAGWWGDPEPVTAVLAGSLVIGGALAGANLALRAVRTGPLVAPQVVASLAVLAAVPAVLVRFADHQTTAAAVTVCVGAVVTAGAWRADQRVLAVGQALAAALAWASLPLTGLAAVADRGGVGGQTFTWPQVAPFLVAAALVGAAAALPVRQVELRQLAFLVASGLVGIAAALALVTTPNGLVLLGAAGSLLLATCAVASPRRAASAALGVAALGYAVVASCPPLLAVADLAGRLLEAVAEQRSGGAPRDLLVRADVTSAAEIAAGWTVPVAAAAVVLAALCLARGRRPADPLWPALLLGWPVVSVTVLLSVPSLLLAVVAAAVAASLHLVAALRGLTAWGRPADVAVCLGWTALAGTLGLYHPAAFLAVAVACAVVTTAGALGGSRPLAAAAPVLVAATVAAAGWLLDAEVAWAALATVVVVCLHALAIGGLRTPARLAGYVGALPTALLVGTAGAASAGESLGWLAVHLVVIGTATAAVAVLERSREAAWIAAALQLGATWVRLVDTDVAVVEAYTLPLAGVLLAFGAWTLWRDPEVGSGTALTPGLTAALLPSLLLVAPDPVSLRALLVGAGCAVALLVAATWRLRAPLVVGASAGAALVVVELAPYHDAVPRWFALGLAGLALLAAGVRWEQLATAGRRGWGRVAELR